MVIVEDNEDERLFLKEGFIRSGLYDVVGEAENGNEMLEVLHRSPSSLPDVILSDLNMPVKDGYEVISDIKTTGSLSHIPVIILSTAPSTPFAEWCKKLGALAYYTKPDTFLDYKEFAEKIYNDVKDCIINNKPEYSSIKRPGKIFMQDSVTCFLNYMNSIRSEKLQKVLQFQTIWLR